MERHNEKLNRRFWVDDILVDSWENTIRIHEEPISLEPLVMQLLLCLARHPGEVLSREYLISKVWNGKIPNDEGLSQAVWKLRTVLGDSSKESRYIQTVPKRGYRLKVPVRELDENQKALSSFQPSFAIFTTLRHGSGILLLVCGALILLLLSQADPSQENMRTIEEQQWLLTGSNDSIKVTLKALSAESGASLPHGVVDSLVFEALKAYENQQAIADSLQLDNRVDKVSIRRKLSF